MSGDAQFDHDVYAAQDPLLVCAVGIDGLVKAKANPIEIEKLCFRYVILHARYALALKAAGHV